MKAKITIIGALALILGACSSTYRAGVAPYDDLYYTPSAPSEEAVVAVEPQAEVQEQYQEQYQEQPVEEEMSDYEKYRLQLEQEYLKSDSEYPEEEVFEEADTVYYDEEGANEYTYYEDEEQPVIHNHYYGDNYYYDDYSYATRIRRFHSPYIGYSYYDPWYYDPWYYDPWYSGFHMSIGWGWGWGWGYSPYYYPRYHSYWGWGYPYYGSYWSGYRYGYWDGYWGGRLRESLLDKLRRDFLRRLAGLGRASMVS